MSFEIIHENKPSYSKPAGVVIVFLSLLLFVMAVFFAYLFISGKGTDYIMGTILAFEFLISGILLILFAKYFISFRHVAEDRKEEFLW